MSRKNYHCCCQPTTVSNPYIFIHILLHQYSGSREAQASLFRYSIDGDLTGYVAFSVRPEVACNSIMTYFPLPTPWSCHTPKSNIETIQTGLWFCCLWPSIVCIVLYWCFCFGYHLCNTFIRWCIGSSQHTLTWKMLAVRLTQIVTMRLEFNSYTHVSLFLWPIVIVNLVEFCLTCRLYWH